ncbi:hypothetical protein AHMF7605_00275 [Adhaeribacter arboris]|uniref:Glycosyltransferase 2-like domain-containing protein n=1 Tax=Adhaeribacter arboris TaxID=2072846 RepID=A0A2T2Y981_9BACT|nr:glycosyltransferase family 2 protein [Adhaeribacter arboris]PSR52063.1 hypothetical protein AHMF7605_00275 [Adhaeribacter arboris]
MDLSIIIVNFRTFTITVNCIKSIIANLRYLKYEIILVDNAPIEDFSTAFKEVSPNLTYIKSLENIGFGRANNLGMTYATGRYILLINSDTLVFDDSLLKCYQAMEADTTKKIGLLGCKLLNEDKSFQPSFYPFRKNTLFNHLITNNWLLSKIFGVNRLFQETNVIMEVGDVSGAFMLLRKIVIDKVGGFDPDFFLYCEESEWCRERIAKYFKIIYFPMAAIIHLGGKSAPQGPMNVQAKLSQALLWYKKGWFNYMLYIVVTYLSMLVHISLLVFIKKSSKNIILADIKTSLKIFPYLFTDVIKYKKTWGNRKKPLIYEGAKAIFFDQ